MNTQDISAGPIEQAIMDYPNCKYLETLDPVKHFSKLEDMKYHVDKLVRKGLIVISVSRATCTENVLFMENDRYKVVARRRSYRANAVDRTVALTGGRDGQPDRRIYIGNKDWYIVDSQDLLSTPVPSLDDDLAALNKVSPAKPSPSPKSADCSWRDKIRECIAHGDAEQDRQNKLWRAARAALSSLLS